jgi:hypothetical protein
VSVKLLSVEYILSILCFSASLFGIVMRLCMNTLMVLQWMKKTGDERIHVTPRLAQVTVVGVEKQ